MSGTSIDGIDVARVHSDGETLGRTGVADTFAYRAETADGIRAAIAAGPRAASERERFAPLERLIAEDHAAAFDRLITSAPRRKGRPAIIGFHGQSVFHAPRTSGEGCAPIAPTSPGPGVSVQFGDAMHLATLTGIDVVHDFRAADVARGGEGAPLAPLYQSVVLDALDLPAPSLLLNIGGVSNLGGRLGAGSGDASDDTLVGFDCGPGNALMDDLVRARTGAPFDAGGAFALAGRADLRIVEEVLDDPFFARPPPRSLDRQAFARLPALARLDALSLPDALATLAAVTVGAIVASIERLPVAPRALVVAGGGQHNRALLDGLRAGLDADVSRADDVGLPGDFLEAELVAFLAVRHLRGLPLTFPSTTGVDAPCPGGRLARAPVAASTRGA